MIGAKISSLLNQKGLKIKDHSLFLQLMHIYGVIQNWCQMKLHLFNPVVPNQHNHIVCVYLLYKEHDRSYLM